MMSVTKNSSEAKAVSGGSGSEAEVVLDSGKHGLEIRLGEGALWDHRNRQLLFVDILTARIFIFDPQRPVSRANPFTIHLSQHIPDVHFVGTVVFTADGHLAVSVDHGFALIKLRRRARAGGAGQGSASSDSADSVATNNAKSEAEMEELQVQVESVCMLASLEEHLPGNRFNDGKCDPRGHFWAGSMDDQQKNASGALYSLDPVSLHVTKHASDVRISNGIVWSHDHRLMYYIDTPDERVDVFDYDASTGAVSNRRVAFHVPEEMGWPDGSTLDKEGMLWIAHWGGSRVTRWDPRTGAHLLTLMLPVSCVTSCAFGGDQLDLLYVTCASNRVRLQDEPLAGSVFVFRNLGVQGVPAYTFNH